MSDVQVRLSEALARMRLSPTVERGDVAEALRLIKVGHWVGWDVKGAAMSGLQCCPQPSTTASSIFLSQSVCCVGLHLPAQSEAARGTWYHGMIASGGCLGQQCRPGGGGVRCMVWWRWSHTQPHFTDVCSQGPHVLRRLPCSRLQQTQPQVSTRCPALLPVSSWHVCARLM